MSLLNPTVSVTNHGAFFFPKTTPEITPKQRQFLPAEKGSTIRNQFRNYGPNKVDQFRNIILKSVLLIIAAVTTN